MSFTRTKSADIYDKTRPGTCRALPRTEVLMNCTGWARWASAATVAAQADRPASIPQKDWIVTIVDAPLRGATHHLSPHQLSPVDDNRAESRLDKKAKASSNYQIPPRGVRPTMRPWCHHSGNIRAEP
jgi:hypothetical protein